MAPMPKKWKTDDIYQPTGIVGLHDVLCWHSFRMTRKRRRSGWCLVWSHSTGDGHWYLSGIVGRSTESNPDWRWCAVAQIGTTTNDHSQQRERYRSAPTNDDIAAFFAAQCPNIPPDNETMKLIENYRCGTIPEAWMRAIGQQPIDVFTHDAPTDLWA